MNIYLWYCTITSPRTAHFWRASWFCIKH